MTSPILRAATRGLLPPLLLYSVFLLFAGHDEPGGGFVGGLVAASAFALYALSYGVAEARRALRLDPRTLVGLGLLFALGSGLLSLVAGEPFMTGLWVEITIPDIGTPPLGTPVLFDIGVYHVVVGVALMIILPLAEE